MLLLEYILIYAAGGYFSVMVVHIYHYIYTINWRQRKPDTFFIIEQGSGEDKWKSYIHLSF